MKGKLTYILAIGLIFCILITCLSLKWGYQQHANYLQWKANAETMSKQAGWYMNRVDSTMVSSNIEIKGARADIMKLYPGLKEELTREFNTKFSRVIWYNKNILEANYQLRACLIDTILPADNFSGFEEITSKPDTLPVKSQYFTYKDDFFEIYHYQRNSNVIQNITYQDTIYQVIRRASKDSVYKGTGFGWWLRRAPLEQVIKMGCKDAVIKYSRVIHVN